nr:copia protein [Tanacetum cinerariifolium]
MESVKKSTDERAHHKREYESRVNDKQMQTIEEKFDTSKALDASLVDIESSGPKSKEQDTSSRSGNDAHADDADIRPVYAEEPMVERKESACAKPHHMIAPGSSRWKPTGKIFKTVGLRWVPTGKILTSSTTKVDSEPPDGSNENITNPYECEQTLNVNAGSNTLSWKPCQGGSSKLNLPDHMYSIYIVKQSLRNRSLIPAKSDSLPHAHAQTTKTYYKHQDSRIKKAQVLKTKTFANSYIKDPSSETKLQGRFLASFQDDAKYKHINIKGSYKEILKRIRNQAVVQDGRVDIQTKNAGYGGNANENAGRNITQGFNTENTGHYARKCQKPKVHDSKYFREQMLLSMKDEAGSNLNNEENNFMFNTSYEEGLKELTAAVMLMARIQLADKNVETVPSYDATAVSQVHVSFKVHEQVSHGKRKTIIQTTDYDQMDSNIIFDDLFTGNNGGTSEHDSTVHDKYREIKMLAYNVQREAENQKLKATRAKHQKEINEMFEDDTQKTYAFAKVRAQNQDLLMTIFELKSKLKTIDNGKHVNTEFDISKPLGKLLWSTSTIEKRQQHNANIIARGMYKINQEDTKTPDSKTNTNVSNSTGVGSSNSVRRPKSKDNKSKNNVLKNTKSSSTYGLKTTNNVSIDSNKCVTKPLNVCQTNACITSSKIVNAVNDGLNIVCISCGLDVFLHSHKKCVAHNALTRKSSVKRALFTFLVPAKSKSLGATSVVAKSRFNVAKTPTATNKKEMIYLRVLEIQISILSLFLRWRLLLQKASLSPKLVPSTESKLELLHIDLCGPMRVASINGKKYILVVVDDYSRFVWVYFLRTKDEAPDMIINFVNQVQRNLKALILTIRTDNGTEFKNKKLRSLCYPINDHDDLRKMKPKADIGIFIGYSESSRGFRIYNRQTKKIMETMHVKFDELKTKDFECDNLEPGMNYANFNDSSEDSQSVPSTSDLDNLFGPMYEEYYVTSSQEVSDNFAANTLDNDHTSSSLSIDSGFELIAYADAGHVRCNDDCKSTSGGIQFLGDKLVKCSSKKQDCTTMSSAEAEYMYHCLLVVLNSSGFEHNCWTMDFITTRFQSTVTQKVQLPYLAIPTEYQLADLFTKAIPNERFEFLAHKIGMRCMTPTQLEYLAKFSY